MSTFLLSSRKMSVLTYYSQLRSILDELIFHQHLVLEYRQDLINSKFVSDLDSPLPTLVQGQIIAGESVPSLTATYSKVLYVPIESTTSVASPPAL